MREEELLAIFPGEIRKIFTEPAKRAGEIQEIRLRVQNPVLVLIGGEEKYLSKEGRITEERSGAKVFEKEEAVMLLQHLCHDSVYAFEEEIRKGYLTIPGGHRIGLAGEIVLSDAGEVKTMKNISCFNIRIAHEVRGAADGVLPCLYDHGILQNTLIISPPGCGKTTLLRDLIRQVSNGNAYGQAKTVSVIDERSELGGSFQGIPQTDVGWHTDLMDGCPKRIGMMMMLRSMSPQVMAIDELGGEADALALMHVIRSGVAILVTIHGESIEEIREKLFLESFINERIFKRYILLSKRNRKFCVERILDEEFKPC